MAFTFPPLRAVGQPSPTSIEIRVTLRWGDNDDENNDDYDDDSDDDESDDNDNDDDEISLGKCLKGFVLGS